MEKFSSQRLPKNIRSLLICYFSWWGWKYRNITIEDDLEVDVREIRQLLDDAENINQEERIRHTSPTANKLNVFLDKN